MTNEWYIQIFPIGRNKKEKEKYNIIENKTINRQEIGIGFCDTNPILVDNKMINTTFTEDLSNRQKSYRKRMFEYFINTMKIGDTVYLKKGKEILYKAKIASDYYFDDSEYRNELIPGQDNTWFWRHRRKIKDIEKIYEIKPGYSRQTLYCKKL